MGATRIQSGRDHTEPYSPIYQAVMTVNCKSCRQEHRILLSSDDHEFVSNTLEFLITSLRLSGHSPIGAVFLSRYPSTDLNVRKWDAVTDALRDDDAEIAF